jgi:CRISPR-associated protein Cas1
MATLYVIEPGARLEKEYQRLLVTLEDQVLLRVPLQHVSQVVLVGNVGVTTPALHALLQAQTPLILVGRGGKLLGRLLPATAANLPLRQAQYRCNQDVNFQLSLARRIVAGKIRNQRVLASRLDRRRPRLQAQAALEQMGALMLAAQQAESLESLLGVEGQAARLYFGALRGAFNPQWQFDRRTRRPPKDPVNALLSLGYTFLGHALQAALEVVGLDPYLGFFHAEKYGRPALALDLVEEFRAPLVDSLTLTLVNHKILTPDDFELEPQSGGYFLKHAALRLFLEHFSRRLEAQVLVRTIGRELTYRKLFEVQARKLAAVVKGESEAYTPFRAR